MAERTWLDVASGWIAGETLSRHTSAFTPSQMEFLQRVLKESFQTFAKEMGTALGSRFSEVHTELDTMRRSMEIVSVAMHTLQNSACELHDQSEEVTVREATSSVLLESKTKKNHQRKQRRQRAKQKCVVQRSLLLQLRPVTDVPRPMQTSVESLLAAPSGFVDECGLLSGGVPAAFLALQCRSVTTIQRAWRKHYCIMREKIAQFGTPAAVLAEQCRSARFVQSWWRFKRRRIHLGDLQAACVLQPDANAVSDEPWCCISCESPQTQGSVCALCGLEFNPVLVDLGRQMYARILQRNPEVFGR